MYRAHKGAVACQHLVEHRTEAEDVTSRIHPLTQCLLWGHVGRGTRDLARGTARASGGQGLGGIGVAARYPMELACGVGFVGSAFVAHQFGEAEIKYLHPAVSPDHDVGRFQVAMNDAVHVRCGQRISNRNCDTQELIQPHSVVRDERVETLAPHILHHDKVDAVGGFDLVYGDDVRMIEGRDGLCFLDEPAATTLVAYAVWGEHFDRDIAVQAQIAGAIHLAHPPSADESEYLVRPERRTRL